MVSKCYLAPGRQAVDEAVAHYATIVTIVILIVIVWAWLSRLLVVAEDNE